MDELPVEAIAERYPDEWVLVEVTRSAPSRRDLHGRVLAHASDQEGLDAAYREFRRAHPEAEVYEFFTGSSIAEGVIAVL